MSPFNKLPGGAALAQGLGQSRAGAGGKHVCVSRVQTKQGLVEQGMYREQENSHLEWPGHALHDSPLITDRLVSVSGERMLTELATVYPQYPLSSQALRGNVLYMYLSRAMKS